MRFCCRGRVLLLQGLVILPQGASAAASRVCATAARGECCCCSRVGTADKQEGVLLLQGWVLRRKLLYLYWWGACCHTRYLWCCRGWVLLLKGVCCCCRMGVLLPERLLLLQRWVLPWWSWGGGVHAVIRESSATSVDEWVLLLQGMSAAAGGVSAGGAAAGGEYCCCTEWVLLLEGCVLLLRGVTTTATDARVFRCRGECCRRNHCIAVVLRGRTVSYLHKNKNKNLEPFFSISLHQPAISRWFYSYLHYWQVNIKGTVAWDFCPLVFFINRPYLGPCLLHKNFFEFCFEFAELFEFEILRCGPLRNTNFLADTRDWKLGWCRPSQVLFIYIHF